MRILSNPPIQHCRADNGSRSVIGSDPPINDCYLMSFSDGLRPDPIWLNSEWADEHRILPRESSNEYGKYRMDRTPYFRVPLDCLSPQSPVKIVTIMKPTQVGCTDGIGNNWLLAIAHSYPAPCMMMLPTVELAKRHSKTKIAPSVKAMSCMDGLIHDVKEKGGGNTLLVKEFPGGSWMFVGSNSASALRSVSVKYLILDDIDGYEQDVNGEGDPAELARKRMDAFSASCKELRMSTPTIREMSKIQKYFDEGDQSYYHVPCPHCGQLQTLEFGGPNATYGLKWDKTKSGKHLPKTTQYLCRHCGTLIPEHYKTTMLSSGIWIATDPTLSDYHRSFSLNSLYSPFGWVSWEKVVREFLEAKHDHTRTKYQVWMNTRMGLTYESEGERPEWVTIKNRAEPYKLLTVPAGGLYITAGVDVQEDRFSIMIMAWGRAEEAWVVYWGEMFCDTSLPASWTELDEFLSREFPHASGLSLKIHCYAVDSGYRTNEVYNHVRQHTPLAIAIKGSSTAAQPTIGRPTLQDITYGGQTIKQGVQLWPVGTDTAKSTIYARLKITSPGPRYIHTPIGLSDDFYRQLTSEKYVTRYDKLGKPKREWVLPSGRRNEALDVIVYALAAAIRSGLERMDWTKLESIINYKSATEKPTQEITAQSALSSPSSPPSPRRRLRRSHSAYISSGASAL